MYLTICALSSLHRTHNKDGTKTRGRVGEWDGAKDELIAYTLCLTLKAWGLTKSLNDFPTLHIPFLVFVTLVPSNC